MDLGWCGIGPAKLSRLLLTEELTDQSLFLLVANPRKKAGSEFVDGGRLIKWESPMHRTAGEVAGLTSRREDRLNLLVEIDG